MEEDCQKFELPKLYRYSGLFVIIGLILLHWSQSMYFVAGQAARLGSLGVGFGLIILAAYLRARGRLYHHIPLVLFSGLYFSALALLSKVQGHMIFYDKQQQIFCLVCLVLFWCGYILASEKKQDFISANQIILVVIAGVAIISLSAFLSFVKDLSFYGTERGYADTTLNPVGVAYANACLGIVLSIVGLLTKSLWRKSIFFMASALALLVVLSSASRGAVIWLIATAFMYLALNRKRKYISIKGITYSLVGLILILPILVFFYKTNYGISERIDVLFLRLESIYLYLIGQSVDGSIGAREGMWQYYMSNIDNWIFLGEKGYSGYPHNQWLEIGVRFGLLGLPIFAMSVFLFTWLINLIVRGQLRVDLEYSIIFALFLFSYFSSMTSLSLQVNRALWLGFGYLLGFYISRRKRHLRFAS